LQPCNFLQNPLPQWGVRCTIDSSVVI
jgi:hypothetical protein